MGCLERLAQITGMTALAIGSVGIVVTTAVAVPLIMAALPFLAIFGLGLFACGMLIVEFFRWLAELVG